MRAGTELPLFNGADRRLRQTHRESADDFDAINVSVFVDNSFEDDNTLDACFTGNLGVSRFNSSAQTRCFDVAADAHRAARDCRGRCSGTTRRAADDSADNTALNSAEDSANLAAYLATDGTALNAPDLAADHSTFHSARNAAGRSCISDRLIRDGRIRWKWIDDRNFFGDLLGLDEGFLRNVYRLDLRLDARADGC